MKKKKAILIVSFGTSHLDALVKTIQVIEQEVKDKFADCEVYRAFSNQVILNRLKEKEQLYIHNIREAMEQMAADGIETVIVQPTHIINGLDNDKMIGQVMEYTGRFRKIRVGKPLLSSVEDYKKAVHAVMAEVELAEAEVLVLMGYGTDHHANSAYPSLEYTFHCLGYQQVLVGTAQGFPNIRNVLTRLENMKVKKVLLLPFLVVAGGHAKNDMAGDENSWKTVLLETGYEVRTLVKGLGEMQGIRNIFIEHIEEVI